MKQSWCHELENFLDEIDNEIISPGFPTLFTLSNPCSNEAVWYMAYAAFLGLIHIPLKQPTKTWYNGAGCQSPRRMTLLSSCWPFTFHCCCEGAAPRNTFNPRTTFCAMIFMILVHLASCCSQRLHGIAYAISRGVYLKIKGPLRQIHLSFSTKLVCFYRCSLFGVPNFETTPI